MCVFGVVLPLFHSDESDELKKDKLRVKMEEYLSRTETLKQLVRTRVDNHRSTLEVTDQLCKHVIRLCCSVGQLLYSSGELSADHAQLPVIIQFHKKTLAMVSRKLSLSSKYISVLFQEKEGKFNEALERHKKNIQHFLKIAQGALHM